MKQILAFVMLSALLCWFMFAPVYKHILIMRQAALQKEVDYMLEVGANASHGYIDEAMIAASRDRLAEIGFTPGELAYRIDSTIGHGGTDASEPLLRGTGLRLTITYPYQNLSVIDRLAGIDPPPEGERIGAAGMKMSEYIPSM